MKNYEQRKMQKRQKNNIPTRQAGKELDTNLNDISRI
jgi:hypothetical protein